MRLREFEVKTIKDAVSKNFGTNSRVSLFGSRTDDSKKGGDIDLLVETDLPAGEYLVKKIKTLTEIKMKLGGQKIDMIITDKATGDERLITAAALNTKKEL